MVFARNNSSTLFFAKTLPVLCVFCVIYLCNNYMFVVL